MSTWNILVSPQSYSYLPNEFFNHLAMTLPNELIYEDGSFKTNCYGSKSYFSDIVLEIEQIEFVVPFYSYVWVENEACIIDIRNSSDLILFGRRLLTNNKVIFDQKLMKIGFVDSQYV